MRFQQLALSLAALASSALAQTPQGVTPSTSNNLPVKYGSTVVTPGIKLPIALTASAPTISYPAATPNTNYMVLLIDFSIPARGINMSFPGPKVPGLGPQRYTRLHYWQTNVAFSSNGTLATKSAPIAPYQGPQPPPGDGPHTYAFFLFPQTSAFVPPANGTQFGADTVDKQSSNRYNFDILALSKQAGVGSLAAANYIVVENTTATASGTAPSGTGAARPTGTGALRPSTTAVFKGAAVKVGSNVMGWAGAGALLAWLL